MISKYWLLTIERKTIFIQNLPENVTENQILAVLKQVGIAFE